METLKYSIGRNMATGPGNGMRQDTEVDSLLLSSCWGQNASANNLQNDYLLDSQKLILDNSIVLDSADKLLLETSINQDTEIVTKATMDALDSLLLNSPPVNSNNLAELKPLPPFTGYTGHLSINGIQGHHYHAIAQRIPEENNNTYNSYGNEHNIVSSTSCISADSANLNSESNSKTLYGVDDCADSVSGVKLEYVDCSNPDSCVTISADSVTQVKSEMGEYDMSSIEDIAAIIGSAIADTTVPNNNNNNNNNHLEEDPNDTRDSWMDLDEWIDGACVDNSSSQMNVVISQEGLSEFIIPTTSPHTNVTTADYTSKSQMCSQTTHGSSTLQTLLTHGYMPLLQNRLQNGPPVKHEAPSSTSFGVELISTSSPPANVVSTTDSVILNGRYMQQSHYNVIGSGLSDDRICSPDLLGQNYPHTTTTTPTAPKKSRSRSQKKQQQQTSSSTVYQSDQTLGLLGKEKPVHRCNICNRGFLNKSNIKVHLRTHTGEKPFRCDTCAKAFRQKAHLLKHQQTHKRIGRD